MRGFEIISQNEWVKTQDESLYENVKKPVRATKSSAGYDFFMPYEVTIKPNEEVIIKSGIKAYMQQNEVLMIHVRSSLGFKYNIRLKNQTGIIDSDYYNNSNNEGHIMVALKNEGNQDVVLHEGDRFVQGIFTTYLLADDDASNSVRNGGFGSTNI